MKNKSHFKFIFKIEFILSLFIIILLTSCSGSVQNGIDGSGIEGNSNSGSDIESTQTQETPMASIPLPSLTAENILAYSADESDYVPVTGGAGAVSNASMMVVSQADLTAIAYSGSYQKQSNSYFRQAFAEDNANTSICDSADAACCPVNEDGSFECFYALSDLSSSQINLALLDSDGNIDVDSIVQEDLQSHLSYLRKTPDALTTSGSDLKVLAEDTVIHVDQQGFNEGHKISGDYESNYALMQTSATEISASNETDTIALLDGDSGIQIYNERGSISLLNQFSFLNARYHTLRNIDDLYFIGLEKLYQASDEGIPLYHYNFSLNALEEIPLSVCVGSVCDLDNQGQTISHSVTLDYSKFFVDDNYWLGVLYLDASSQASLRIINFTEASHPISNPTRFGSLLDNVSSDIQDLTLIHSTTDGRSRFSFLDKGNSRIVFGDINFNDNEYVIRDSKSIAIDSSAVKLIHKNGYLFLLKNNGTLDVISLLNSDGSMRPTPTLSNTITLSQFLSGSKNVSFDPVDIDFTNDFVQIADRTTKGLLEFRIDSNLLGSLPDEAQEAEFSLPIPAPAAGQ